MGLRTVRLTAGLLLAATTGCASAAISHEPAPAGSPGVTTAPADDCPAPSASKRAVMIDYVDFVHHDATEYIADLHRVAPITAGDLGQRVLTVKCSFAQINDATSANPGPAHEADAAFLLPGTPVFSIKGWSPSCRLAARHDGHWRVYLAYRPGARVATPKPCALTH